MVPLIPGWGRKFPTVLPCPYHGARGAMLQGPLGNGFVVALFIVGERGLQVGRAAELEGTQELGDPTVEPFDHPIRLGRPGGRQAVFRTDGGASLVEHMFARGGAFPGPRKPVREFFPIVCKTPYQ